MGVFLQVFVQPFFRSVVGLPSVLQVVRTHPGSAPAAAPRISAARMLNATAAYVAWTMLGGSGTGHDGPLTGYRVRRLLQRVTVVTLYYKKSTKTDKYQFTPCPMMYKEIFRFPTNCNV